MCRQTNPGPQAVQPCQEVRALEDDVFHTMQALNIRTTERDAALADRDRLAVALDIVFRCSRDRLAEIGGETTTYEAAFHKLGIVAGALMFLRDYAAQSLAGQPQQPAGSEGAAIMPVVIEGGVANVLAGDIANTAERYAQAYCDVQGHTAVTINPLVGPETVEPFLRRGCRVVIPISQAWGPELAAAVTAWVEALAQEHPGLVTMTQPQQPAGSDGAPVRTARWPTDGETPATCPSCSIGWDSTDLRRHPTKPLPWWRCSDCSAEWNEIDRKQAAAQAPEPPAPPRQPDATGPTTSS